MRARPRERRAERRRPRTAGSVPRAQRFPGRPDDVAADAAEHQRAHFSPSTRAHHDEIVAPLLDLLEDRRRRSALRENLLDRNAARHRGHGRGQHLLVLLPDLGVQVLEGDRRHEPAVASAQRPDGRIRYGGHHCQRCIGQLGEVGGLGKGALRVLRAVDRNQDVAEHGPLSLAKAARPGIRDFSEEGSASATMRGRGIRPTLVTTNAGGPMFGLTEEEASRRLAERGPIESPATSRSYASIVRGNVFTIFNLILLVFGVLTLAFGKWQDALFLGVLVSNSGIGIFQEVRAKRALDRLAALVAPSARVVRDGRVRAVHASELVPDDLVRLEAGDQVVADGSLEDSNGLRVDESILTGESEAVSRAAGEEVRSGSFAVEGVGAYTVTAVGPDSYAERIAGEARTFRHPRSPLERSLNRL